MILDCFKRGDLVSCTAISAALMLSLAALSACGSSIHRGDPLLIIRVPERVTVTATTVRGLGPVLTDAKGHVLYMFPIDVRRRVSCTGGCAGTWPPLVIAAGHRPTAAGAVKSALLGTMPDPNTGAEVVTYGGYPLYRYYNDTAPDMANGQDLLSDGAPWYTLTPAGRPITTQIRQADTIQ
jgi:predicted lipoprotein with Yx(FWY)xxD motif